MTIHDKTDESNWTDDVNNWTKEFDDGDLVIADGYASFSTMTVVSEIDFDAPNDNIVRRGVFWKREYAELFAEILDSIELLQEILAKIKIEDLK